MNPFKFLKPTRVTWKTILFFFSVSFINFIFLHYFDIGSLNLAIFQTFTPLLFLESLGINLLSYAGKFASPNFLGYLLGFLFNFLIIYIISLILTFPLTGIRNLLLKDSEEDKELKEKFVGPST